MFVCWEVVLRTVRQKPALFLPDTHRHTRTHARTHVRTRTHTHTHVQCGWPVCVMDCSRNRLQGSTVLQRAYHSGRRSTATFPTPNTNCTCLCPFSCGLFSQHATHCSAACGGAGGIHRITLTQSLSTRPCQAAAAGMNPGNGVQLRLPSVCANK